MSANRIELGSSLLAYSILILLISTSLISSGQQDVNEENSQNKTSTNKTQDETTTATILSSHEFVDFTETPTLLFNGLSNESAGSEPSPSKANASNSPLESTEQANNQSLQSADGGLRESPATTTSQPLVDDEEMDNSPTPLTQSLNFEPPKNVSQYMDYIEQLFHDLRHQIVDLLEPHIPQLIRSSQMVQLSGGCSYDMLRMALALRQFEPWALRMIDSSGKVPEGIFEGSFTALGSYDECLATVFSGQPSAGERQTQGKYCLVNISPFLPPKPPADKVDLIFREEANRRNYSKDDHFSRLSPMFYYMKFRIGLCIPSSCIDSDMESIGTTLSSSLRLNITISNCHVKQEAPLTRHQLLGGLIFGSVLALVLVASFCDFWISKSARLRRKDERLVLASVASPCRLAVSLKNTSGLAGNRRASLTLKGDSSPGSQGATSLSSRRAASHWSWMSFSALANFKLHFTNQTTDYLRRRDQQMTGEKSKQETPIVACLNGIRVLSVCWVIVANSYITLDPRATKRLVMTREAPKDFLFQLVAQASLAIETFFFLSGLLMSLSFGRKLKPAKSGLSSASTCSRWFQFYLHRYLRMTPATMLVIALTMFAFRFGDGPLWSEATQKAHLSCNENWWRHLVHVANFIDTRQMCFIHYWYVAADMQLFLLAPIMLLLLYRRKLLGYSLASCFAIASFVFVFYKTYARNLPPTLLFYNSDPESRREFGNTIMTKPLTHALPYIVGVFLGKWLSDNHLEARGKLTNLKSLTSGSMGSLLSLMALGVALAEIFLPYKWNNSQLPSRLSASLYAALFRFSWSLVLAYLVLSCGHRRGRRCKTGTNPNSGCCACHHIGDSIKAKDEQNDIDKSLCFCGSGGNLVNRFLGLQLFTTFSKLSFVAYLIHLPLMSVLIAQTRTLFAFSHTLVIHLALSYLVTTFALSFLLVHIIEFPFLTYEGQLLKRLSVGRGDKTSIPRDEFKIQPKQKVASLTLDMSPQNTANDSDRPCDDSMISQRL